MDKAMPKSKVLLFVVSVVIMFGSKFIPAPGGLTVGGFQTLTTMLGALILWLGIGVDWTNFVIILSLCLIPGLGVNAVSAGTLGNNTVFFVILCFIIASCLQKTGVTRRICIWFMTNRFSRKGPWNTLIMMYAAAFFIALFLPAVASVMVALPIFTGVLEELNFKKGGKDQLPQAVVLGTVVSVSIGVAACPISHAQTIIGMTSYTAYTGGVMELGQYIMVGIPVGIVCLIATILLIRFLGKPDVSSLKGLDYDALKGQLAPMSVAEKWAAGAYLLVILFWLIPGITKDIFPNAYATVLSKINNWYPPLVAIIALMFVNTKDGPVLNFKQALRDVPWSTCIFVGVIMFIGSLFSRADFGLTDWLSSIMEPVVQNMSPFIFIVIMIAVSVLATNVISNTVTVALVFAIAMPLVLGGVFGDSINPMALAALMTIGSNMAFATPPGGPPIALACDSGWLDSKLILKWGLAISVVCIVVIVAALPLANAICR